MSDIKLSAKKEKAYTESIDARMELEISLNLIDTDHSQIKNIFKAVESVPLEFLKYVASVIKFQNE